MDFRPMEAYGLSKQGNQEKKKERKKKRKMKIIRKNFIPLNHLTRQYKLMRERKGGLPKTKINV